MIIYTAEHIAFKAVWLRYFSAGAGAAVAASCAKLKNIACFRTRVPSGNSFRQKPFKAFGFEAVTDIAVIPDIAEAVIVRETSIAAKYAPIAKNADVFAYA